MYLRLSAFPFVFHVYLLYAILMQFYSQKIKRKKLQPHAGFEPESPAVVVGPDNHFAVTLGNILYFNTN